VIVHDRRVHFEDIDAAGIVFFARYFNYAHDAMEHLFDALPGSYAALVMGRGIGFPTVHAEADFKAPIRYGDSARIVGHVTRIGETSCAMRFEFSRVSDGTPIATTSHVHVCSDLKTMTKLAFPDDVRRVLEHHLVSNSG
jgi:4-hydroxybenzoyl-CoA thioesterase